MRKITVLFSILLCAATLPRAAGIANPASPLPDARLSVGASYYLGGSTITNMEIPMVTNRAGMRVSYAPINYLGIGFDGGTTLISVERYTLPNGDTVGVFNSDFGWYAGGHIRLTSPVILERFTFFGLATASLFKAENERGAYYGGKDAAGVIGVQMRIPNFGYISMGPHVHLILGDNKSYYQNATAGTYSNLNNVRGWIAVDYFPEMSDLTGGSKVYASLELSISPKIRMTSRIPVQEFSISLSLGTITPRLYGVDKDAVDF